MNDKIYKLIICVLLLTTIVFAILFITKKCDLKCKCDDSCLNKTTSKPVLKALRTDFIITEVNNCSIMAYMTNDDKKTPYSISFCEMDGSADMKFNVGDKIWIQYTEVLETHPLQIKPMEYGYVD